ncbi:MAG: alpha-galactosidase [Clostridia bacterium]|nr:alpha-galactosidase [Clostridia bacterium]
MIKTFQIHHKNEACEVELQEQVLSETLSEWRISVRFAAPTVPSTVTLKGYHPCCDTYAAWGPSMGLNPSLGYSWSKRTTSSRLASGAPVHTLVSQSGNNRLTLALSDAATPHEIATGVLEEDGTLECEIRLFTRPISAITAYEVTLRLDSADRPFYESVAEVENWWAEACGYPRAYVPEAAKLPVYSAWYSFHQRTIPEEILEQCRLSKELGLDVLIVDDGWQTEDGSRGYAFCGDWEVCEKKIPDMKAFVDAVHALDMKFVLWYSVPFVGTHSKMYQRFADKVLGRFSGQGDLQWTRLDPRYPEVREALIDIYRRAMIEWGLDGFKLDFIDSFSLHSEESFAYDPRRDTQSLEEGIDKLLDGITKTLRAINPDVLIEFRQSYIGPVIRKYGNMFRVGDCPADPIRNRVYGVQLRYLLRGSAIHSDMLMWRADDTPESAAKQVIPTLITVPQISVLLHQIPESHRRMLGNYLGFWRAHRDTLLEGKLTAESPESDYSMVRTEREGELIAIAYLPVPLTVKSAYDRVILINGTAESTLAVRFERVTPRMQWKIYDCEGELIEEGIFMGKGIDDYDIPESGRIEFMRV